MTLTVETGARVAGADSYVLTATIDTYWSARPHTALSTAWAAATSPNKEGAAREATAFLDAIYGAFYRGTRAGYLQGLEWPRSTALDNDGYPLPNLPPQLVLACCELAARALSGPLAEDATVDGVIKRKREQVGSIVEETEYADHAGRYSRYGAIDGLLAPILTGSQPTAQQPQWSWR